MVDWVKFKNSDGCDMCIKFEHVKIIFKIANGSYGITLTDNEHIDCVTDISFVNSLDNFVEDSFNSPEI